MIHHLLVDKQPAAEKYILPISDSLFSLLDNKKMQEQRRPDAPNLTPLNSVEYMTIAWEKQLANNWTVMYSHPLSTSAGVDIRNKQMQWLKDEDILFSVCRNEVDPCEPIDDSIITITQNGRLYGFCYFTVPYTERSREEVEMANVYARFKLNCICTHKNSFKGSGTVMLAIISKKAFEWMNMHNIPSCFIEIDKPLDSAQPFYTKLGFKCHLERTMRMKLIKGETDGGVLFPTRGTKRQRSEALMLLFL